MISSEIFLVPALASSLVAAPLPTAEWSITDGAAKVNAGWSSQLGTWDIPLEHIADQAGLPSEPFLTDTGEAAAVAAPLPTAPWSITDGTAKVNAGWSSCLGTFCPVEECWPVSVCEAEPPPPAWSLLFEGLGELWIETTRFLDLLSQAESFTQFLAGVGYLTGFTSEGHSETRFAISTGGLLRFDAASTTEFVPQLSPATPNWGSGVMPLPPSRRRNYGF